MNSSLFNLLKYTIIQILFTAFLIAKNVIYQKLLITLKCLKSSLNHFKMNNESF